MTAPPAGRVPALAELHHLLDGLSAERVLVVADLDVEVDPATAQFDDRFAIVVVTTDEVARSGAHHGDGGLLLVHNLASQLVPAGVLALRADASTIEPAAALDQLGPICDRCGLEPAADVGSFRVWLRTSRYTVHDMVAAARSGLNRVRPADLHAALSTTAAPTVLDTRSDTDRARTGCIAEAIHAPRTALEWLVDPAAGFAHPAIASFEEPIVVVCNSGYSSSLAAANLQALGFVNATDLVGGMSAWLHEGLPVVDADHSHHDPYVPIKEP
jgi:rhodanese-related sulfurtransferase